METVRVPLHQIHLRSELYTGRVKVGVRENLPVCGVTFLLGNDVTGGRVTPFLEVCDEPDMSDHLDEMSERFPVCSDTSTSS